MWVGVEPCLTERNSKPRRHTRGNEVRSQVEIMAPLVWDLVFAVSEVVLPKLFELEVAASPSSVQRLARPNPD